MSSSSIADTVSSLFAKVDLLERDTVRVRKELEEARQHADQLEQRRQELDEADIEHNARLKELYQYVVILSFAVFVLE